jgi:transcriptional regulator with XRE-family HTH domain
MIPERLILLREAHELSQRALAEELGVSSAYISQVEAGKKEASNRLLTKLSCYFRLEKRILFEPLHGTWIPEGPPRCTRRVS